jgi:hypothetical protein
MGPSMPALSDYRIRDKYAGFNVSIIAVNKTAA